MAVVVMVMFHLLAWLKFSVDRVAKFLYVCLKGLLRSLRCIILYRYSLVFERHLEILHAFLESDVFLHLLHAVLAMEMDKEGNLLDFAFLLL